MATHGSPDTTTSSDSYTISGTAGLCAVVLNFPENGTLDSVHFLIEDQNYFGNTAYNYAWGLYTGGTSDTNPDGATLVASGLDLAAPDTKTMVSQSGGGESLVAGNRYWLILKGYFSLIWHGATTASGDLGDVSQTLITGGANGFAAPGSNWQDEGAAFAATLSESGSQFTTSWGPKWFITYTASGGGVSAGAAVIPRYYRMLMGN